MKRALVLLALLWSASARATEFWQNDQNTNGYVSVVSPAAGACFLYETAPFDIQCYTTIPSSFITVPNGVLEGVSGAITGYTAVSTEVQVGAVSGGGLRQFTGLTFDGSNLGLGAPGSGVQSALQGSNTSSFATVSMYPTGGTNVATSLQIVPKGVGSGVLTGSIFLYNTDVNAAPTNWERMAIQGRTSAFVIASGAIGTGTTRPILIGTDSGTAPQQLVLATAGTVAFGTGDVLLNNSTAQSITKSNADLAIEASGAHNLTLKTNGSSAVVIDGSQGVTLPVQAGAGTRCAQFDSTGKLGNTGSPCGSGGLGGASGTVTNVTATPPIFITGTSSVTPNVTIQGAITSGSTSTTAQNLGGGVSGVEQQTVSGGVATLSQYATTPNYVQYGAASGGGLAQSSNLQFDGTAMWLGAHATAPQATLQSSDLAATLADLYMYPGSGTNDGSVVRVVPKGTGAASNLKTQEFLYNTDWVADKTNVEALSIAARGSIGYVMSSFWNGTGVSRPITIATDAAGVQLTENTNGSISLGAGDLLMTLTGAQALTKSNGNLTVEAAGAQSVSVKTNSTVRETWASTGEQLYPTMFTPATPASGLACWMDAFNGNPECKDSAAQFYVAVKPKTAVANQFLTSILTSGQVTAAQADFSNLSGSATCAQMPALTGQATSSAGTCGTKVVGLTDGAGAAWPLTGTWASGQALITSGTNVTTTNQCNVFATCAAGGDLSGTYPNPTIPTKGKVLATSSDSTPNYLFNKLTSSNSSVTIASASGGTLVNLTVASSPTSFIFAYGAGGYGVSLPSGGLGYAPDFWFRPMSYTVSAGDEFAAHLQVWEYPVQNTYGNVDLSAYVYQCGITTTGGVDGLIFEVTKNSVRTGVKFTLACPAAIQVNTAYLATGAVVISPADRLGVEAYDAATGVYSSGTLRATVTLQLRP